QSAIVRPSPQWVAANTKTDDLPNCGDARKLRWESVAHCQRFDRAIAVHCADPGPTEEAAIIIFVAIGLRAFCANDASNGTHRLQKMATRNPNGFGNKMVRH